MMRKNLQCLVACMVCIFGGLAALQAQDRCGSMVVLENTFKKNPALKTRFETRMQDLKKVLIEKKTNASILRTEETPVYIPVVFHIVLTNPNVVTDAQLDAQIAQMNRDFGGLNGDSSLIPAAFKGLFAKSKIQFKLAQRTPNDESSTGIERVTTSIGAFGLNDSRVKYRSSGGANAWDNHRYFNVWITDLSQGYLGYSSFPGSGPDAEDGVVIKYTSLPGGSAPYNRGRTLVHETGHFFFLYHIWGDENGCGGSDFIDDTPNQGTYTSGCPSGVVRTDACSPGAPGIMYQNFMDYTDDACMVMFTLDQKLRMETSLSLDRTSLLTSNGADPVITYGLDAAIKSISNPLNRICYPVFAPVIVLKNRGSQTLTSVYIRAETDSDRVSSTTSWTGSLPPLAETTVTLNGLTITREGNYSLRIRLVSPNGGIDENPINDELTTSFLYYIPLSPPLTESFESNTFPPIAWDIVNGDQSITWERTKAAAKTGSAAALMRNFDYMINGQKDYLRLPLMTLPTADSAYLTFQVAAAATTDPTTSNAFDSLEVLVSKDCGVTFTSLYKKGGSNLITHSTALETAFVPAADEWRKDSVNLTPYINAGQIILAFANTNQNENNIYLDDINVYSVTLNANAKLKGFVITPNPTTDRINVQFYPNAAYVKGINIFSSAGQRVVSYVVNGSGSSSYSFDMTRFASGVYVVQVVLGDRVVTQKIIKR